MYIFVCFMCLVALKLSPSGAGLEHCIQTAVILDGDGYRVPTTP